MSKAPILVWIRRDLRLTDHAALTGILSALSFRKERTHRSKAVELWRQGAINIVVNSEDKGFAAHSRAEHGPGVCDMGLRMRDADQTVKRALMLGAPAFAQPVGAGELDIPAIKGVGGSVVHFIDARELTEVSSSESLQSGWATG